MNKRGFTLIELLAIVILLGILATTATVSINMIIKKGKMSTYKASMTELIKSADMYYANTSYKDTNCIDINNDELDFNTRGVIYEGEICISNGIIELRDVTDGKYTASGTKNNLVVQELNE